MAELTDTSIFEREWDDDAGRPKDYERFTQEGSTLGKVVVRRVVSPHRREVRVSVDHRWRVHSPTGLEYGYAGSGPADLALNILGAFVPPPEAWALHQAFKRDFIAPLRRDAHEHVLSGRKIRMWIMAEWDGRKETQEADRA